MPAPRRNFRITQLFLLCLLCLLVGRGASDADAVETAFENRGRESAARRGAAGSRGGDRAQAGISFQVTPETEKELRGAGATPELLETLRELAPPPPKPEPALPTAPPAAPALALLQIEGAPKGAEIYVDDEFKGQVNREGRLKIPGLSPAKHVVRVSAEGFKEKVETLELTTGETRTYTPNLVSAVRPPAAPPGPKPLLATAGVLPLLREPGGKRQTHFASPLGRFPRAVCRCERRRTHRSRRHGVRVDERRAPLHELSAGARQDYLMRDLSQPWNTASGKRGRLDSLPLDDSQVRAEPRW